MYDDENDWFCDEEDGDPSIENDCSPVEFHVAWITPQGFDKCGLFCEGEARASWIEQTFVEFTGEEFGVIVPLCSEHGHFAAEALAGIKDGVKYGGLLK